MYKSKMNEYIYELWHEQGLSYGEISNMKIPGFISLKRVRNIIYGGRGRLKSEHEKDIYNLFVVKFLELKDVNDAINFVFENQPPVKAPCEHRIRQIINIQLNENRRNKKIK
jgi:hypothetical protein